MCVLAQGPDTSSPLPAMHCRLRRPHHGPAVPLLQPSPELCTGRGSHETHPSRRRSWPGLLEPSALHLPSQAIHSTALGLVSCLPHGCDDSTYFPGWREGDWV